MEETIAYILALVVGIVLGLIGGGGSILTVPIFVYVLNMAKEQATAYSLFVIGLVAMVGAFRYAVRREVDFKTGIIFAIPTIPAIFLTRSYLIPSVPYVLFEYQDIQFTRGTGMMLLFALVMVISGVSMVRGRKNIRSVESKVKYNYPVIVVQGLLVGVLTGLVGAGGGFIIVPALVLLARVPMKIAVGTSLFVITLNSLVGFIGDMGKAYQVNWTLLFIFASISIVGVLIGAYFNSKVPAKQLKKGFGWFVLVMAVVILFKELA